MTVPCDIWTGSLNNKGYGTRTLGGRTAMVHRLAWEAANGPVPRGMELHHVCGNRACREVSHLVLVTHRQNLLASPTTLAAQGAAKTHCPAGHPYDAENTHIDKQGKRHCRACDRNRHR